MHSRDCGCDASLARESIHRPFVAVDLEQLPQMSTQLRTGSVSAKGLFRTPVEELAWPTLGPHYTTRLHRILPVGTVTDGLQ